MKGYGRMNEWQRRIGSMLPALFIMSIIFMFSAQDSQTSNQSSDSVVGQIVNVIEQVQDNMGIHNIISSENINKLTFLVRKLAHTLEYAFLCFWVCFSLDWNGCRGKWLWASVGICFLYACTDELHQKFVPGRSCEFRDVLIDTNGALIGCIIFLIVLHKVKSKKKIKQKDTN